MNSYESDASRRAQQSLPHAKTFNSDQAEDSTAIQTPENDVQRVPALFRLPTTDRHSVPSWLTTGTTDGQTVSPIPATPATGKYTTLSSFKHPATNVQQVLSPQPAMPNVQSTMQTPPSVPRIQSTMQTPLPVPAIQSNVPQQPQIVKKRNVSALDKGTPFIAVIFNILVIVAVLWVAQNKTFSPSTTYQKSNSPTQVGQTIPALNSITNNKAISPLLFGTNMALFHDNDEPILNSPAIRQTLKNIGVRIIRMPTRSTLNPQTEVNAAQAIKGIGAVPLIIINGPEFKSAPLLESDMKTLGLLTPVFGKEPIYFEFGNESDLNGVNATQYASAWNLVIPSLKESFPTARFIAPDNYQFSRRYLKTFLQLAQPRPDGISWHEYTCSVNWSAAFCLSLLDTWPVHFAQARAAMREAIGTELPIWITEWNYASDQQYTDNKAIQDGKYNNQAFINAWTTKAMELLEQNRIFASMQYFATNQPMPLVSNNGQIGSEGTIFQQEYKNVMVKGSTLPVMTVSQPPATLPKNAPLMLSFANGSINGWSAVGGGISQPTISTTRTFAGPYSMKITLANASEDDYPFISISQSKLAMVPKAGQMIDAYVYVDNKAALVNAKLYVSEPNHNWHFSSEIALTPGQWNKVWYALPVNFTGQVSEIGMQFYTSRPGVSSDVYIGGASIG